MPIPTHHDTIPQPDQQSGLSRRDLLKGLGVGALLTLTACTRPTIDIFGNGETSADRETEAREKALEIAKAAVVIGKEYLSEQLPTKINFSDTIMGLMRTSKTDANGELAGRIGFNSQSLLFSGVDLVMYRYDPQQPGIDGLPTGMLRVVFDQTNRLLDAKTYSDVVTMFDKTLAGETQTGLRLTEVSILYGDENDAPRKYGIVFGSEGVYLNYEKDEAGKQLTPTDPNFASALRDTTERLHTELATLREWVKTAR